MREWLRIIATDPVIILLAMVGGVTVVTGAVYGLLWLVGLVGREPAPVLTDRESQMSEPWLWKRWHEGEWFHLPYRSVVYDLRAPWVLTDTINRVVSLQHSGGDGGRETKRAQET